MSWNRKEISATERIQDGEQQNYSVRGAGEPRVAFSVPAAMTGQLERLSTQNGSTRVFFSEPQGYNRSNPFVMKNFSFMISLCCLLIFTACRSSEDYLKAGNRFFAAGRYPDAELNYKKALQKNNRFGEGYYRLGLTESKLGRPVDAQKDLTVARALSPGRDEIEIALADVEMTSYLADPNRPAALYNDLRDIANGLLTRNAESYDGLRILGVLAWTDRDLKRAL